ncbi:MAG: pyridoxamine 5'-phosphate oxidase family protein [Candidatus Aureabacteria bacterium]|nr:pyridoxamine 5'-phosphate oxidase family protein [Candidatus Auribacterota bacterium]
MAIKEIKGMSRDVIEAFENHVAIQIFATLGTCTKEAKPHNSPKIILEFKKPFLYLVDYHRGYSYNNIQENPCVSVSTFNLSKMTGFHLYGKAEIIEKGPVYERLINKFQERKILLCTHEVVEAVKGQAGMKLKNFICLGPVLVYKIRVTKIISIQAFTEDAVEIDGE